MAGDPTPTGENDPPSAQTAAAATTTGCGGALRMTDELEDLRRARRIAAESADRFRDVLCECLGCPDENPGDDVLIAELRKHFGKTGPEPTRWRDFLAGAITHLEQNGIKVR